MILLPRRGLQRHCPECPDDALGMYPRIHLWGSGEAITGIGQTQRTCGIRASQCQARGSFVVGAAAQEARAKKAILDWKITDPKEILVSATCKPTFDTVWPSEPKPLSDFLSYLEAEGCVRVKVIQHNVEKVEVL